MFAVIFLGVLVVTNAAVCEKKNPMESFDSAKYFSAKLDYVQRVSEGPKSVACIKFDYNRDSDGKLTSNYDYYGGSEKQKYHNSCNGTQRSNKAKFSFNCKQSSDNSTASPTFQEEVTVMTTDYKTYSVVNRCVKSGGFSSGNILVLSKDKDSEDPSNLEEILKGLGETSFQHVRKTTDCKY
ncbi:pallidipin-like isoform X2 [Rhodnius prolixus]